MESEAHPMSDQTSSAHHDPAQMLAAAQQASADMAHATEFPRGFMLCLVALVSTGLTLIFAVPWFIILCIGALLVPLGFWYFFTTARRAKPRTLTSHSGPYTRYFLLFLLLTQCARFWIPELWWEFVAKWILLFLTLWFCAIRMRASLLKHRLKDAHENII